MEEKDHIKPDRQFLKHADQIVLSPFIGYDFV